MNAVADYVILIKFNCINKFIYNIYTICCYFISILSFYISKNIKQLF